MKKSLLLALAVPAMFAACSQDDLVQNVQNQEAGEYKVAGEVEFVINNDAKTRLSWGAETDPVWDPADAFSMMFVPTVDPVSGAYVGTYNAWYRRENSNESFKSESVLYEGKHFLLYPAQKNHTTIKELMVSVGAEQDGSLDWGKRAVYVSDVVEVQPGPVADEDRVENTIYAGYAEPVGVTAYPLTSNFLLNLKPVFPAGVEEVTINSVTLSSNSWIFTVDGYLVPATSPNKYVAFKNNGVAQSMTLKNVNKTLKSGETCQVQFAILPTVVGNVLADATYTITVATNYGDITINKAIDVIKAGKKEVDGEEVDCKYIQDGLNTEWTAELASDAALNFGTEFTLMGTYMEGSYGKRVVRDVTVDVNKADINGKNITTSEELIDAYRIFDALGKKTADAVSFNLIGKDGNVFDLTPEALKAIIAHDEDAEGIVTLNNSLTAIKWVASTTESHECLSDVPCVNESGLGLMLGANGENGWTLDEANAKIVGMYNDATLTNETKLTVNHVVTGALKNVKIINNGGDVTLNAVALDRTYDQKAGTTTINGEVSTVTQFNIAEGSSMTVSEGAKLIWKAGDIKIDGTVTVDGTIESTNAKAVIGTTAVVTLNGEMKAKATNNKAIVNTGTINKIGTGYMSLSANTDGTNIGSVVLDARNREVKINELGQEGYIKWMKKTSGEFAPKADDTFNYLIVNKDVTFTADTWSIAYLEVAATLYLTNANNATELTGLFVNEGCILKITKPSTFNVTDCVLNGDIQAIGTFSSANAPTGSGIVY